MPQKHAGPLPLDRNRVVISTGQHSLIGSSAYDDTSPYTYNVHGHVKAGTANPKYLQRDFNIRAKHTDRTLHWGAAPFPSIRPERSKTRPEI